MNKEKKSLSFYITILVAGMVSMIVILTAFIFISLYRDSISKNAMTSSEQAVVQVADTISDYIEDIREIMNVIEDSYGLDEKEREERLKLLNSVRTDLVAIFVYDEEGNIVNTYSEGHTVKEKVIENLSYIERDEYEHNTLYLSKPHVESMLIGYYPWVVSVLQDIKGSDRSHRVVIDILFSKIASHIDSVGIGQHGYCYIIDGDGSIIYHPQQQLLYAGLKNEETQDFDLGHDGSFEKGDIICSVKTLNNCDWKVVGVSYVDEMVTAKLMEVLGTVCIFFLIITGVIFISSFMVSKMVTGPIDSLIRAMRDFEKNAEEYSYHPVGGSMEMQELSDSFEHMVGKIKDLMNKVRQEEISLRKTELKALQAQINPHFLYNTLDAIGWMCEEERCEEAVLMVNALAKLFRISISRGHEIITIEKEVEHARSYLMIEKFRYKNRFTYDFDVSEECLNYYCNKITLQPIIENAIAHGISPMVDEGYIHISIYREGNDVIMKVSDNGVGMTKEQCRKIMNSEPGDNSGIGIKNVNDRIRIYFGGDYGLTIESEPDEGTTVIIRMPVLLNGEDVR